MTDLARVRAALAGRYVVEKELGRGGMARVYLARDLKHGRHVALKVLGSAASDAAGTERFLREIRTTARLTHPAILPLHDSGEVDGVPFYTMPWVDGESLSDVLAREGALPIERALQYAACVAEALAYAHEAGVVHRDIKPDNILIARTGHIWVSDFGLAHALAGAANARLSAGFALGSPPYMSPEQALGQEPSGGATDVYSLGCMLYEMLAGAPPFDGPVATVLSRQITAEPPDIRSRRPDVPDPVAALLAASLSKDAAERPDASTFEAVVAGRDSTIRAAMPAWQRRRARVGLMRAAAVAAVAAGAAITLLLMGGWERIAWVAGREANRDSTSYAVLAFAGDEAYVADVEHLLSEAIGRWREFSVVDPLRVADLEAQRGRIAADEMAGVTRDLGASRYVRGDVRREREWLHIHAWLYEARGRGRPLAEASVRVPASLDGAEALIDALADSLLFHDSPPPVFGSGTRGTHSVEALRAYLGGHAALRDWEPARADSLFTAALQIDPSYSQARLWHAQLLHWAGRERSEWSALASQAALNTISLNPKERLLADALSALGSRDFVHACARYDELARSEPYNFMALYGLGECVRRDSRVVPDTASLTGWRFRSSAQQAVNAYRRAFTLLPASHKAFRGSAFDAVRNKFYTSVYMLRSGSTEDGERFVAAPQWLGDSLVFLPIPEDEAGAASAGLNSATTTEAVRRMRIVFHDVTRAWVDAYPKSPSALEAHAVALELTGSESALDVLRRARAAVTDDPDYSLHLLVLELWLRSKRALPRDTAALRGVVAEAEALLADTAAISPVRAERLASLAAFTGRASLAASLARRSATAEKINQLTIPPGIIAPGRALLSFATLNGPVDSIRALESSVDRAILNAFSPAERKDVRAAFLVRAATIAFPVYRSSFLTTDIADRDYLVAAQLAFARGDTAGMRRALDQAGNERATVAPAGWKPDALHPEAWLFAQAFGLRAAGARLCPMLNALEHTDPGQLSDFVAAGSLPLSMLLYSRALRDSGEIEEADRWYNAVAILWKRADPHLRGALRSAAPRPPATAAVKRPATQYAASSCFQGGSR